MHDTDRRRRGLETSQVKRTTRRQQVHGRTGARKARRGFPTRTSEKVFHHRASPRSTELWIFGMRGGKGRKDERRTNERTRGQPYGGLVTQDLTDSYHVSDPHNRQLLPERSATTFSLLILFPSLAWSLTSKLLPRCEVSSGWIPSWWKDEVSPRISVAQKQLVEPHQSRALVPTLSYPPPSSAVKSRPPDAGAPTWKRLKLDRADADSSCRRWTLPPGTIGCVSSL